MANTNPRPEKRSFPLRLPLWVLKELRRLSREEDASMADIARRMIEKDLRERGLGKAA